MQKSNMKYTPGNPQVILSYWIQVGLKVNLWLPLYSSGHLVFD